MLRSAWKRLSLALGAVIICSQFGCIALNIPSERFHDSDDHGGPLGHWRNTGERNLIVANSAHAGCSIDGGPLEDDPFDPSHGEGATKPPEVPWPRFHPVPTAPVFGPVTTVPFDEPVH